MIRFRSGVGDVFGACIVRYVWLGGAYVIIGD